MFKKILSSLFVTFLIAGCSDAPQDAGCEAGAMSAKQASFMDAVGMDGDRVFFDYDKSSLTSSEVHKLDAQVKWMQDNSDARIDIEGHCDARGTSEYNLGLGKRRAEVVKAYLVSKGVNADRINTVSYGKERPAVIGSDAAAYAKNRRSVTVIVE